MVFIGGMRFTDEEAKVADQYTAKWRAYEKQYGRRPPLPPGMPHAVFHTYHEIYGRCEEPDYMVRFGPNAGMVWDPGSDTYKDPDEGYNH